MVPAATPGAIVTRLNTAARAALAEPAVMQRLAALGAEPTPSSPADLAAFIRSKQERWGTAVRQSGASVIEGLAGAIDASADTQVRHRAQRRRFEAIAKGWPAQPQSAVRLASLMTAFQRCNSRSI